MNEVLQMDEKKKYEPEKEDDVFPTSVYHLPEIPEEELIRRRETLGKTIASRTPEEWARIGTEHRHQRRGRNK